MTYQCLNCLRDSLSINIDAPKRIYETGSIEISKDDSSTNILPNDDMFVESSGLLGP